MSGHVSSAPTLLPGGRAPAIERAPGTSRWGLRFADAGSERAYDLWYLGATRFFSRAGLLASVVAWALVFLGCSLAVEGAFINGFPYVFAAMAVVVASLVVTFVASLSRWVPLATAFANAFAGLAAIGFRVGHPRAWRAAAGRHGDAHPRVLRVRCLPPPSPDRGDRGRDLRHRLRGAHHRRRPGR